MKRVYVLLIAILALCNLGTRVVPSTGGGGISAITDISDDICTSGQALQNTGTWVCSNWPVGGAFTFDVDGDDATPAETIADGNTLTLAGGVGIDTDLQATDTVVFNLTSAPFHLLSDPTGDTAVTFGDGEEIVFTFNNSTITGNFEGIRLDYNGTGSSQGAALEINVDNETSNVYARGVQINIMGSAADQITSAAIQIYNTEDVGVLSSGISIAGITVDKITAAFNGSDVGILHALSIGTNSIKYTGGVVSQIQLARLAPIDAALVDLDDAPTWTGIHTFTLAPVLPADTIDAITQVAAALKTGADLKFVTGTAGSDTHCAQWNADGDLVTAGAACGGAVTLLTDIGDVTAASIADGDILVRDQTTNTDWEAVQLSGGILSVSVTGVVAFSEDYITAAMIADGDWGDFSIATNSATLDIDTVGLAEMAACNEAEARIVEYDSSGVPTCKIAIQTALVAPAQYEYLMYNGSAWVDTTIDLAQTGSFNSTILTVVNGGTDAAALTDGGVLLGSGTGAITPLGQATNGQLVIGSSGGDPVLGSITGDSGLSITSGAGTITIDVDLNTAADASGSTGNLSGMEFTATDELALLQGCTDEDALLWQSSNSTWVCEAPVAVETNTLTTMTGVADDEIALGASANVGAYVAINDCNAAGYALTYDTATNAFGCLTGISTGGTVDSIQGDGDVATTGAILSIDGGTNGVDTTVTSDTLTINLDLTEIDGAPVIFGNNTTSSWSWDVGGASNPTIAFADDSIVITNAATFTVDGNAILDAASTASALTSVGTLTVLAVDNITINGNTISSTAGTDLLITPLAGQQLILDTLIIIDNGVIIGATSITSTAFVGDLDGDITGNANTVTAADAGGDATTWPMLALAITGNQGASTDSALTYNATTGALAATSFAGSGAALTGIPTSALTTEVRTMAWGAGAMSTDSTECANPTEVAAIGGAGGPEQWAILCPMGTSETDGFLYGSTILLDSFNAAADVTFLMSAVMDNDGGAGTFHGSVGIQCVGDTETVGTAWGTEADVDFIEVSGDIQWDIITAAGDAAIDTAGCVGKDTFWWRWKACDTDATPSTNCTSSTASTITDLTILSMRMEYTTDIGD